MSLQHRGFLDQEAPPGYIAGIGRGATGFTTRSDIGNARLPPQTRLISDEGEAEGQFADAAGEEENGLLSSVAIGNKEDEEADEIYREIEVRLLKRGKRKLPLPDGEGDDAGQVKVLSNLEKISNQFVDLKKDLSSVSAEQWASLPEVGDLTRRNKRLRMLEQQQQKSYAAPDTLLSGLSGSSGDSSVNISSLNSERHKLLGSRIDASLSFNEDDSVDSTNYLNQISSLAPSVSEEDTAKMKTILNSYTKADPKNPQGWIARARVEELDKKFEKAKKLISEGCSNCPNNEDIWIENVRLNQYDVKISKIIIAEAIKFNNKSLKLWLKAIELENEIFNKKRVIRKAIENIPTSAELWLRSIDLEDDTSDKLKIVTKAIEIIPNDEKLWLKLICLQNYTDAKKTLNKARKALNNNVHIWLEACRLEAVNNKGDVEKLGKLVKKMIKDCDVSKDGWFQHAIEFENQGLVVLTNLIVETIMNNVEDEELNYSKLVEDSNKYKDHVYVCREILSFIALKFPKKVMIWRKLIQVYKTHFSKEELYSMFEKTIATIPKMSVFWLMYSKEVWKSDNNIVEAGAILNRSLEQLPKNVDIFLALIKLQLVSKNIKKAEELFQIARSTVENERIDYKYITFLRQTSTSEKSLTEVNKSLIKFPNCYKLYLQKSQILQESNDLSNARETLSIATKELPHETILWKHLSDIDLSLNNPTRARSDLDLAILKNPTSDDLWLHKLQLELKLRNTAQLSIILNTALQKFPHSSLIWDFNLRYIVTKAQRKVAYQDALSATNNDVRILLTIGVNFWRDGKVSKSKKWFERAIETDEDFGDAWAWLYDYLERQDHNEKDGIDEKRDFLQKFNNIEPSHGDVWPHVAKRLENLDKEPVELLRLVARELIESR